MKKVFFTLLAAGSIALVACGSSEEPKTETPAAEAPATEVAPAEVAPAPAADTASTDTATKKYFLEV
ncbi:MAG: hypothetical protein ACKOKF_08685 [Bacteroidota bacterium]